MKKTTKILMILSFCFCIISACVSAVFALTNVEIMMGISNITFQTDGWLNFSVSNAQLRGLTKQSDSGEMKGFTITSYMDDQDIEDYVKMNGWNSAKLQFKSNAKGLGQIAFTVKNDTKYEGTCLFVHVSTNKETDSYIKAIPSGDFYLNKGQHHTFTIDLISTSPTSTSTTYTTISGLNINVQVEEVIASEEHCTQEWYATQGYTFTLNDDDYTATLTKFTASGSVANIPDLVQNNDYDNLKLYTVTKIADATASSAGAFYSVRSAIKSIVFPSTLVSIGNYAFYYCQYINTAVNIPNSVERIGQYAFYYGGQSTTRPTLTLSSRLREIGARAFYYGKFSGSIKIPRTMKIVQTYAFYNCSNFTSLSLSYGLEAVKSNAFNNCYGLKGSLNLPDTLTEIGDSAFSGTGFSGSLTIPGGVKTISSFAFATMGNTYEIYINEGVQVIKGYAFGQSLVEDIYLPSTLKTIESCAFDACESLSNIITFATTPPTCYADSFPYTGIDVYAVTGPYNTTAVWKEMALFPISEWYGY